MGEVVKSFGPTAGGPNTLLPSTFPLDIQAGQTIQTIATVEVDNASNLTLSVFGDGQLIRTLTPYISRWNINTSGGWQNIHITANTAAIQTADAVTIIAYDAVVPILFPPSFGVSAWGSGAVPNQLVSLTPGNSLAAWNINQLINLLTGVMTGQIITVANTVETVGASGQFASMDQDGVGGDFFSWFVNLGLFRLVSSVGGTVVTVGESGSLVASTLQASATSPSVSIQNPGIRNYFFSVDGSNNLQCQELVGGANIFQIATNILQMRSPFYPSTDANAAQSVTALHANNGVPNNANGNNGDFYFRGDGAAGTFIYHKAAGTWTAFA